LGFWFILTFLKFSSLRNQGLLLIEGFKETEEGQGRKKAFNYWPPFLVGFHSIKGPKVLAMGLKRETTFKGRLPINFKGFGLLL